MKNQKIKINDPFSLYDTECIQQDIKEALKAVEEKYNVSISLGSARYGQSITSKIEVNRITETKYGKIAYSKEAAEFLKRAESLGVKESVLNQPCMYKGEIHKILGYNTRGKRFPIKIEINGENRKCTVGYMKEFIYETNPELAL